MGLGPKVQDVQVSRTQNTVGSVESVLLYTDAEGRILSCSPALFTHGLLPPGKSSGYRLEELPSELSVPIGEALEVPGICVSRQVVWNRSLGLAPITVTLQFLPVPSGSQAVLAVSMSWITPSEAATAAASPTSANPAMSLAQSQPALFAGMAHDIKNSLVGVKTLVELSLEREPGMEMAKIVKHDLDRISFLVSQMLRSAGPAPTQFSWVRIHPILDMSLQLIQSKIGTREIRVMRDFRADRDEIWGDSYQIEQAFLNLLINGIEAIPGSGELTVRTRVEPGARTSDGQAGRPAGSFVVISITDTGSGVAPEHAGRLFDDFFTTKSDGTGLGLPITRRIGLSHHGEIAVQSTPGKGTTFELRFPLKAGEIPIPA